MAVRGLVDILFPPSCLACGRVLPAESFFCEACDAEVAALPEPRCQQCAEPGDFAHHRCGRCALNPPPFARAHAPFVHDGAVARAIHQLKYEDHPEHARDLAALLAREAASFLRTAPPLVCSIPLHVSRRRERKFDQAELLAGELARVTGRRRIEALERRRATHRQVGLTERDREQNVHAAFEAIAQLTGAELLLVDDVFTTGATARAAAQALIDAGASRVEVLTIARAWTA